MSTLDDALRLEKRLHTLFVWSNIVKRAGRRGAARYFRRRRAWLLQRRKRGAT